MISALPGRQPAPVRRGQRHRHGLHDPGHLDGWAEVGGSLERAPALPWPRPAGWRARQDCCRWCWAGSPRSSTRPGAGRFHTTGQLQGLIHARDKTCRAEGCDVPANWCHVHHRSSLFGRDGTDLRQGRRHPLLEAPPPGPTTPATPDHPSHPTDASASPASRPESVSDWHARSCRSAVVRNHGPADCVPWA